MGYRRQAGPCPECKQHGLVATISIGRAAHRRCDYCEAEWDREHYASGAGLKAHPWKLVRPARQDRLAIIAAESKRVEG